MDSAFTLRLLCLFCCGLAVYAGSSKKPSFCQSGLGPFCSKKKPCKPGYSCIVRRCCRDPVCPLGMEGERSCNLLPGQEKCPFGYDCINNFCCRNRLPSRCPFGSPGPICKSSRTCKPGYYCFKGVCCRRGIIDPPRPKCPRGQYPVPGSCKLCPKGATCYNGRCCRPFKLSVCPPRKSLICPAVVQLHECQKNTDCKPGYFCCTNSCRHICVRRSYFPDFLQEPITA